MAVPGGKLFVALASFAWTKPERMTMSDRKANGDAPGARPTGQGDGREERTEEVPEAGPTAPASVEGERPGPQTGGYDRQSPDRSSDNARGGYGAG